MVRAPSKPLTRKEKKLAYRIQIALLNKKTGRTFQEGERQRQLAVNDMARKLALREMGIKGTKQARIIELHKTLMGTSERAAKEIHIPGMLTDSRSHRRVQEAEKQLEKLFDGKKDFVGFRMRHRKHYFRLKWVMKQIYG